MITFFGADRDESKSAKRQHGLSRRGLSTQCQVVESQSAGYRQNKGSTEGAAKVVTAGFRAKL